MNTVKKSTYTASHKNYYERNRESEKLRMQLYYQLNKERLKAKRRLRYQQAKLSKQGKLKID
jgi:hypothetical protein